MKILILPILAFVWNYTVYSGARMIAHSWTHIDMTSVIDTQIPFVPWTAVIYIGWYIFWAVNYILCAAQNEVERNRFYCADALSKAVCFLFFLILPTTNIRPEITEMNVFGELMRLVYSLDSADNLFPSIHCLVSWLCWIGVRNRKDIPYGYRIFSLLSAIAVCISTLTTKQHVIADVFGGIILAEISYAVSGTAALCKMYSRIIKFLFRLFRMESVLK